MLVPHNCYNSFLLQTIIWEPLREQQRRLTELPYYERQELFSLMLIITFLKLKSIHENDRLETCTWMKIAMLIIYDKNKHTTPTVQADKCYIYVVSSTKCITTKNFDLNQLHYTPFSVHCIQYTDVSINFGELHMNNFAKIYQTCTWAWWPVDIYVTDHKTGWWKSTFPFKHPVTRRQCVGENLLATTELTWLILEVSSYSCIGLSGWRSHSSWHCGPNASNLNPKPNGEQIMRPSLLKLISLINPRPTLGSCM